jgi:hypothetical protein
MAINIDNFFRKHSDLFEKVFKLNYNKSDFKFDEKLNHHFENFYLKIINKSTMIDETIFLDFSLNLFNSFLLLHSKGIFNETEHRIIIKELIESHLESCINSSNYFLSSLINSYLNIIKKDNIDVQTFILKIKKLGDFQLNFKIVLDCIGIIAWISGLTEFRMISIENIKTIPIPIIEFLFDIKIQLNQLDKFINNLKNNPFNTFEECLSNIEKPTRLSAKLIGGFIGFRKEFYSPVQKFENSNLFFDNQYLYKIYSDSFGSFIEKMRLEEIDDDLLNEKYLIDDLQVSGQTIKVFNLELKLNINFPISAAKVVYGKNCLYFYSSNSFHILQIGIA